MTILDLLLERVRSLTGWGKIPPAPSIDRAMVVRLNNDIRDVRWVPSCDSYPGTESTLESGGAEVVRLKVDGYAYDFGGTARAEGLEHIHLPEFEGSIGHRELVDRHQETIVQAFARSRAELVLNSDLEERQRIMAQFRGFEFSAPQSREEIRDRTRQFIEEMGGTIHSTTESEGAITHEYSFQPHPAIDGVLVNGDDPELKVFPSCRSCEYYSGSMYLKCAVNPDGKASECQEFKPHE